MPIAKILRPRNADGLPVIISTIGGEVEDLVLGGKDTPNTGVETTSELRSQKRYYAGYNEATVHIMGQKQIPIELEGRLYDRNDFRVASLSTLAADSLNPLVGGPRLKAVFMQALFDAQVTCRLQWGQNIDVEGYITKLTLTNFRHNVIGYRIEFDPVQPFNPATTETADKLFGVLDQDKIGQFVDQASLVAQQLYETVGKTVVLATSYASREPSTGGDLPDTLTQDPFSDDVRTNELGNGLIDSPRGNPLSAGDV